MVWQEPKDRNTDFYFCMMKIVGFLVKTRSHITYSKCLSVINKCLSTHDLENPVSKPSLILEDRNASKKGHEEYEGCNDEIKPSDEEIV